MGRYFNTSTGRGGKFGFACQSSSDPHDYFEMEEQEPTEINYYAEEKDIPFIKKQLNKIYEQANVPQEERIYCLKENKDKMSNGESEDFYKRYHKYFFETCKSGEGNFAGANNQTEREVFKEAHLAMCRLWLGLVILSDIKDEGYCELSAEI